MINSFRHKNQLCSVIKQIRSISMFTGKDLKSVVKELEKYAPPTLAESWDNVGLLIEPYKKRVIKKILLTNDLTQTVVNEAINKDVDMIIAYHPPIFKPIMRITQQSWKERVISACIHHNIAVYSPHTAWDKIQGGVNDWLAHAIPITKIRPLQEDTLTRIPGAGLGRIVTTSGVNVGEVVVRLQNHIQNHVHVALAVDHNVNTPVRNVAICAGSGALVLKGTKAELIITGEMSHHDILDFNHNKTTVLLCNHSNSERGFLLQFQREFSLLINHECELQISQADKDPLTTFPKAMLN